MALAIVLVTIVVMAIGSTVVIVNISSDKDAQRITAAATALERFAIEVGQAGQQPSFRGDMAAFPLQLSQLVVKLTTSDKDSCGINYPSVLPWRGPYHLTPMLKDRLYDVAAGFTASDTLVAFPPVRIASQDGLLYIVMRNVALADAQALNMKLDGNTNGTGPKVSFTPNGNAAIEVRYAIPIRGC